MSQNNNPFAQMFSQNDFMKTFQNYQPAAFDIKSLMELQRKNLQAFTEAQQVTVESIQAIAQRQGEILTQMLEENSSIAKEMMGEGSPEDKAAKNADLAKSMYEKSIKNMREISDMLNKSSLVASDIINKRVSDNMSEIKTALKTKKAA